VLWYVKVEIDQLLQPGDLTQNPWGTVLSDIAIFHQLTGTRLWNGVRHFVFDDSWIVWIWLRSSSSCDSYSFAEAYSRLVVARLGSFWSRNEPTMPQAVLPSIARNPAPIFPFMGPTRASHSESGSCDSFV
jgi:hypothetical protein